MIVRNQSLEVNNCDVERLDIILTVSIKHLKSQQPHCIRGAGLAFIAQVPSYIKDFMHQIREMA